MPKLKTHKASKKRIAVTKTGKFRYRHTSGNHFLEKKSGSRKRQFAGLESLSSSKQIKNLRRKLGL